MSHSPPPPDPDEAPASPRDPISHVLRRKLEEAGSPEPALGADWSLRRCLALMVDHGQEAFMVLGAGGRVLGMLTGTDILRAVRDGIGGDGSGDGSDGGADPLDGTAGEHMTAISKVVYSRPEEAVYRTRRVMGRLGLRAVPILRDGRVVEGIVTLRDMAEFGRDARDRGGKKAFLDNMVGRTGLVSERTSMADPEDLGTARPSEKDRAELHVSAGVAELPHPFKTAEGRLDTGRRSVNVAEYSVDPELSEDAYFTAKDVRLGPDGGGGDGGDGGRADAAAKPYHFFGVADGVGSWREYGVDPKLFSHRLMFHCHRILREIDDGHGHDHPLADVPVSRMPATVLAAAHQAVKEEDVIGSCTANVAVFDGPNHQLHFANLGDSGLVVLRHIDSNVVGTLKRDRTTPRTLRKSDLRVTFVSQQQLRSFNHPYQLGWTGEEIDPAQDDGECSFRDASESCCSSLQIRRGDVIIMATDGLFDNVDIDDIVDIVLEWEQQHEFIVNGDLAARNANWRSGNSCMKESIVATPELAKKLCDVARENSLDNFTDSPFALLAKENDIMWSGGMPDDCTIIALHISGHPPLHRL